MPMPKQEVLIPKKTIFIRTLLLITLRKLYRVALPFEVHELYIQARNYLT